MTNLMLLIALELSTIHFHVEALKEHVLPPFNLSSNPNSFHVGSFPIVDWREDRCAEHSHNNTNNGMNINTLSRRSLFLSPVSYMLFLFTHGST